MRFNSSRVRHPNGYTEVLTNFAAFSWQDGYAAFTVGISQLDRTIAYIANQREHHRTQTFQEEYLEFLRRHGVEYDERYLWD